MMNNYGLKVATEPAEEPVTLIEQKLFSRVDTSADDDLISSLISAARRMCEQYTHRAFVNTTYDLTINSFTGRIQLPRSPLSSVTSITYLDTAGDSQVLATSVYRVVTGFEPGIITLDYGQSWPSIYPVDGPITVRFVAGYGAEDSDVPADIRHAIKLLAHEMYEHREYQIETKQLTTNRTAVNLLSSFCVRDLGGI